MNHTKLSSLQSPSRFSSNAKKYAWFILWTNQSIGSTIFLDFSSKLHNPPNNTISANLCTRADFSLFSRISQHLHCRSKTKELKTTQQQHRQQQNKKKKKWWWYNQSKHEQIQKHVLKNWWKGSSRQIYFKMMTTRWPCSNSILQTLNQHRQNYCGEKVQHQPGDIIHNAWETITLICFHWQVIST